MESEAETIECKFRSNNERSVLLDTKSMESSDHRILLLLIQGELEVHLNFGNSYHVINLLFVLYRSIAHNAIWNFIIKLWNKLNIKQSDNNNETFANTKSSINLNFRIIKFQSKFEFFEIIFLLD